MLGGGKRLEMLGKTTTNIGQPHVDNKYKKVDVEILIKGP